MAGATRSAHSPLPAAVWGVDAVAERRSARQQRASRGRTIRRAGVEAKMVMLLGLARRTARKPRKHHYFTARTGQRAGTRPWRLGGECAGRRSAGRRPGCSCSPRHPSLPHTNTCLAAMLMCGGKQRSCTLTQVIRENEHLQAGGSCLRLQGQAAHTKPQTHNVWSLGRRGGSWRRK